jgi:hypothetical protein
MKLTPTPTPAPEHAPEQISLTDIRIVVAGLGQDVLVDGSGHATRDKLFCTGTLVTGQSFEKQGDYDIRATQANHNDAKFAGGNGTHKSPWTFNLNVNV